MVTKSYMIYILVFALSVPLISNSKWYGVFTTDSYPVNGCTIVRAHDQIFGFYQEGQYSQNIKGDRYTKVILDALLEKKKDMIKSAKKIGYNALVGFRTNVYGGFSAYGGQTINGSLGLGAFVVEVFANPVLITCKN